MRKSILIIPLLFNSFLFYAQNDATVEVAGIEANAEEIDKENEKGLHFQATGDVYYRYGFNVEEQSEAPTTAFANLPGFSLGMADLVVSQDWDKVGLVADLAFGPRAEDATFLSGTLRPGGSSNIVNQLYVDYALSDKVSATLGNFNTYLGYEVINPSGNFNYSTSYMFSYGPFSHTGLKINTQLNEAWSVMGGVFNQTDETEYNFSDQYAGGAQIGYNKGKASIYGNALFSKDFFQGDVTAGFDLSDDWYLGINSTWAQDNFWGAASYLQYSINDDIGLGSRVEYFKDEGVGALTNTGDNVVDLTFTGNFDKGNLRIIPEFRVDLYSEDQDFDYSGGTELKKNLGSFLLAAVYNFER